MTPKTYLEQEPSDFQNPLDVDSTVRMISKMPVGNDEFKMEGLSTQEQSLLFTNDALVLPDSVRQYTKAVSAIHAVPDAAMTASARRLMDACILVAQLYHRKLSAAVIEEMRDMRVSPMFEVRTNYLRKLGGIRERNVSALLESFKTLRKVGFRWNVIGEDSRVEFNMQSSFVTTYGTGEGKASGWVRFALEPAVLTLILEPRMFAAFSLQVMDDLRTESSYALYQATFRYVNSDQKVTPRLPVHTWIELIKGPSSYVDEDPATGEKKVKNLHDFKRRDLIPAINRINEVDALNYSLELCERKSGPKIVAWWFKFIPKKQQVFRFDIPGSWPVEMKPLLLSLGFKEPELVDMAQGYSTEEISEALRRLELAEQRHQAKGSRIYSRRHFLTTILEGIGGQKVQEEKQAEEIETIARRKAEEDAAQTRQKNLQKRFADHQQMVLTASMLAMSHEQRGELVEGFKTFARANLNTIDQRMVEKDSELKGPPVQLLFRKWLEVHMEEMHQGLLPYPQDRDFQAWMMWQMEERPS